MLSSHETVMPALVCFLPQLIITPSIFLSLGVLRGHASTLPHFVQSKWSKNGPYKYEFSLSVVASKSMRMFEDQIYINCSEKHPSNIGLEAYHNVVI